MTGRQRLRVIGTTEETQGVVGEALAELLCPVCGNGLWQAGSAPTDAECANCRHHVDLLSGLIRLQRSGGHPAGIAQRLMHSAAVVALYERAWRPMITWLATDLSYDDELAFLRKHLPTDPAARILDWCCGTGWHGRMLATQLRPPGLIVGVDSSPLMAAAAAARAAAQRVGRQVIVEGAIREVHWGSVFDAGYCFAALHLLDDQAECLAHMARALRSGAPFLCLTLHQKNTQTTQHRTLGGRIGFRLQTREQLEAMMSSAGFDIGEVIESRHALMIRCSRH